MIHTSRGGRPGAVSRVARAAARAGAAPSAASPRAAIDDPERCSTATSSIGRERERQVIAALAAGRATVQAIAESIYDGLAPALMPAAHENVRAHLEKLQTRRTAR